MDIRKGGDRKGWLLHVLSWPSERGDVGWKTTRGYTHKEFQVYIQ